MVILGLTSLLSTLAWCTFILFVFYCAIPVYKVRRSGLKHPPTFPLIGTTIWVILYGIQYCYMEWIKRYGHLFVIMEGPRKILVVSDPQMLKDVLVKSFSIFPNRRVLRIGNTLLLKSVFTSEDEEWRDVRRILIPTFTSYKMKTNMFPLMYKCSRQMVTHFMDKLETINGITKSKKVTIDSKAIFGCLTMDVIASTAFGLDLDSYQDANNEFVVQARKVFEFEIDSPLFILWNMFPFIVPVFKLLNISITDESSLNFFINVIESTVAERKSRNIKRHDYLQLLIDCSAENDDHKNDDIASIQKENHQKVSNGCPMLNNVLQVDLEKYIMHEDTDQSFNSGNKGDNPKINPSLVHKDDKTIMKLTREQYVANAFLFFVAGYETTANALSWITNTLAWYPEVQERLREEVLIMWNRKNGHKKFDYLSEKSDITYEDVLSLKYLDVVVKEVMRLYPPVTLIDRVASHDYILDGEVFVEKGTIIQIPIYAMHRDPTIWADPDDFRPERFEDGLKDEEYSYMPFGFGPRNCIGLRFALLEIKLSLVLLLLSGIRFSVAQGDVVKDKTPYNTQFKKNGIHFPAHGLKVSYELI